MKRSAIEVFLPFTDFSYAQRKSLWDAVLHPGSGPPTWQKINNLAASREVLIDKMIIL